MIKWISRLVNRGIGGNRPVPNEEICESSIWAVYYIKQTDAKCLKIK
jgi:hypothetical protein